MKKKLYILYKKYLKFREKIFVLDALQFSTTLKPYNLSKEIVKNAYQNFYQIPFLTFCYDIKTIIYSQNPFEFITKNGQEHWMLWPYLKFLKNEGLIKIKKEKINITKKEIFKEILPIYSESQIRKKIEKELKIKIRDKEPVIRIFKNFFKFKVKKEWDQLSISQASTIFLLKKIFDYLPLKEKFLLVGDDDFISLLLGLVQKDISLKVIDADKEVVEIIKKMAKKFNFKIDAQLVDIRKKKRLNEKFIGFLTNPVYTAQGIKEFVNFGKNQLGKRGGFCFLEVGDEAIGNRFLELQEFFSKSNLRIREIIPQEIFYPFFKLYPEDDEIFKRMLEFYNQKTIEKSPWLGAFLYIFEYIPKRSQKKEIQLPFYAYL